ncbi:hypothetical protein [Arabiibacter massiliensis]|uniref:hypothetical protein n=1 Tax=Arabiibacter massiliensis TaxID=1870985 RepID=UPI001E57D03A|nr:hypothetical protein [Arabiibacter massiliensis]
MDAASDMTAPASRPPRVRRAVWVARLAFLAVFVANVQCAVQFVLWPEAYAGGFELAGVPGAAAVRGIGVAFLMWNATYPAVIASPLRFRALAVVVLAQQLVGLVGETWIRLSLPAGHVLLAASIERFVAFDAAGLVLMAAAFVWLMLAARKMS